MTAIALNEQGYVPGPCRVAAVVTDRVLVHEDLDTLEHTVKETGARQLAASLAESGVAHRRNDFDHETVSHPLGESVVTVWRGARDELGMYRVRLVGGPLSGQYRHVAEADLHHRIALPAHSAGAAFAHLHTYVHAGIDPVDGVNVYEAE